LMYQAEPDNPEWWVEQSYANNNLGSQALARGYPVVAAPYFAASIELKQRALSRTRLSSSSSIAAELADSYSWLAWAREGLGELAGAESLYAKEMQLVQELRERFPDDSMWIYRKVRALTHHAVISVALGRDQRALQDYDDALRLFTPIVGQDEKNRAWQVELAGLEQDRLRIVVRHVDKASALPALAAVHRRFQHLLQFDPKNAAWAEREAVARLRLSVALPAGRAAQQQLDAALARLQALHASNPSNLSVRLSVVDGLLSRARIQQDAKDAAYLLSCREAYGIIDKPKDDTYSYRILNPWVRINQCLGKTTEAQAAIKRLHITAYRDTEYLQFFRADVK
jgi:tetratricopeptide (TPR) repeat protein